MIYRIRRADGTLRWARTRGFAVRDGDGRVYRVVGFVEDITERNLEAQALRNARLASIGVLAAGVAHEINNPNNAIQFSASLFTRAWRDVTPILREYVEENGDFALAGLPFSQASSTLPRLLTEITSNSERIRRIVENLKHMSRQDTGELTEKVDIQQVLEAAVMILHNQIQKFTDACSCKSRTACRRWWATASNWNRCSSTSCSMPYRRYRIGPGACTSAPVSTRTTAYSGLPSGTRAAESRSGTLVG